MNNSGTVDITALSTFALQSSAKEVVKVSSKEGLRTTVQQFRQHHTPFVIVGGGSNSLFAPFVDKAVVVIAIPGIDYEYAEGQIKVIAGAGVAWDALVLDTVEKEYSGLEALSAIPGTVGAAPIQNIGAYGSEVSEIMCHIEAYDIAADTFVTFASAECGFAYRTSNFKTIWAGKYVITAVSFMLSKGCSKQITYPGVAALLPLDQPATALMVREAVIVIRWSKLPKPDVLPNLGSFFHNPTVPAAVAEELLQTFPDMPVFATAQEDLKKLSAGWLIEQSGWKGQRHGPVGMYEKNALVMVNYGGATLKDVLELQRRIQYEVQEKFGIALIREPSIIG